MGRPDVASVAGLLVVAGHVGKGPVERVGVDADDAHPLFHQPEDPFAPQSRLAKVLRAAQPGVGPGLQQHDLPGPKFVADPLQARLQVFHGDEAARGLVPHVQQHSRGEAPGKRHLIHGAGRAALAGAAIVPGGIQMGAGVGDRFHALDGPALAAGIDQVLGPHVQEAAKLPEPLSGVGDVVDLGRQRLMGGLVLQRHAQVHQAKPSPGQFHGRRFGAHKRVLSGPWFLARVRPPVAWAAESFHLVCNHTVVSCPGKASRLLLNFCCRGLLGNQGFEEVGE